MKQIGFFVVLLTFLSGCNGHTKFGDQNAKSGQTDTIIMVGGGCDGCELMYQGMPKEILSEHTSVGWTEGKQKLQITGKVFQLDGTTPAPYVILYYWHTDDNGLYATKQQTDAPMNAHGKLRGWVQSDAKGNYTIKTSRPAAYPNDNIPQHIHLSIKEPAIANEYYADLYFDDDPLYVNHKNKHGKIDRAGTELLQVVSEGNVQVAKHNFILGLNIPNYPIKK